MIEIASILGAGALALGVAIILALPLLSRATRLRLITSSYAPAYATIRNYLRVFDRSVLALTALVVFAIGVGVGVVRSHQPEDPISSPLGLAGSMALATALGALCSSLAVHINAIAIVRGACRLADFSKHSALTGLLVGIRWAGAASVASMAIVMLCPSVLMTTTCLFVSDQQCVPLLIHLLPCFALGTVFPSIVSHFIGGVFVSACASLPNHRNTFSTIPTHLTVPATRVADTVSTTVMLSVAVTIVAHDSSGVAPSLVFAPFLVVTLGLVVTCIALWIVRSDTTESGTSAIARGLWGLIVLVAGVFAGASHWLFGSQGWRVAAACALGLTGSAVTLFVGRWRAQHKHHERAAATWANDMLTAAAIGAVIATVAIVGDVLGRDQTTLPWTGITLGFAALAFIATAPYGLAIGNMESIVGGHRANHAEPQNMPTTLSSCADTAFGVTTHAAGGFALAVWMTSVAIFRKTELIQEDWGYAVGLSAAAFVGMVFVVALVAVSLRALAATSCVALAGSSPSDDSRRVDASLQEATRQGIPWMLMVTIVPALVWAALRWGARPALVAASTLSAILGASMLGLVVSLGTSFSGIRRNMASGPKGPVDKPVDVDEKWTNNGPVDALNGGDLLGTSLQTLVGPCIHASVKLLAAAALALAAHLF